MRLVVHPQAFRAALHPACDFNGHGVPDPIERRPREPTAMASAASLVHQDGGAQGLTALLLELPEVRDVRVGVVFAVAATAPQGIALCSLHVLRARDVAERLPEGPRVDLADGAHEVRVVRHPLGGRGPRRNGQRLGECITKLHRSLHLPRTHHHNTYSATRFNFDATAQLGSTVQPKLNITTN